MPEQSTSSQHPHVVLESFKPVSVFLCPCRVESHKITELVAQAAASATQRDQSELLVVNLDPFEEECLSLRVGIRPRLFFLPNLDWVALALAAELSPTKGKFVTFEQMLAFNSNFRVCQGNLDRRDTPMVGLEKLAFSLSDRRTAAQVFEQVAQKTLGVYDPPDALKRAVTLSIAQFEHALDDTELYAFGTIAHSDEIIAPTWAAKAVLERAYDRWFPLGIRFFVHSYSLVCSSASVGNVNSQNPNWLFRIFLKDYVRMGARLALERAGLLELRSALQDVSDLAELRRLRMDWVNSRRILGVRWTAEGTQKAQIEQVWRQASGLDRISEEIDRRFEQTVDLFEAAAAERLNRLLRRFQIVVTGFAAAGLTAQLTREFGLNTALPWTFSIGFLAIALSWVWLRHGSRHFPGRKGKSP